MKIRQDVMDNETSVPVHSCFTHSARWLDKHNKLKFIAQFDHELHPAGYNTAILVDEDDIVLGYSIDYDFEEDGR